MWRVVLLFEVFFQSTVGQFLEELRIVGGHSRLGIPWMASIRIDGRSFCGGALISSSAVVTAAHCFEGIDSHFRNIDVVLGRDTEESQLIGVRHVFIHEKFVKGLFKYDTAVVRLKRPALTHSFARITDKKNHVRAKVVGWGLMNRQGSKPSLMQEANVVIQPDHICLQRLKFDPALSFCAKGLQHLESKHFL